MGRWSTEARATVRDVCRRQLRATQRRTTRHLDELREREASAELLEFWRGVHGREIETWKARLRRWAA